jgi:putative transposase
VASHSSASKPSALIPNVLQRNFDVAKPNKAWVTDITYIRTWQGWLYLAVVMDLFSRKIVGWSTRPTIGRELVLDAVMMAVKRRRPRGTIIQSFFGSLKKERVKKRIYKNRAIATADVSDYIESFYNRTRHHSHLGELVPRSLSRPRDAIQDVFTKSCELHLLSNQTLRQSRNLSQPQRKT